MYSTNLLHVPHLRENQLRKLCLGRERGTSWNNASIVLPLSLVNQILAQRLTAELTVRSLKMSGDSDGRVLS